MVSPPARGSRVSVAGTSVGVSGVFAATLEAAENTNNLHGTVCYLRPRPHGRTLILDTPHFGCHCPPTLKPPTHKHWRVAQTDT